jgi:hypothetical protein
MDNTINLNHCFHIKNTMNLENTAHLQPGIAMHHNSSHRKSRNGKAVAGKAARETSQEL